MNRNIEVIKLKVNYKTGGLDILYFENVELKTEKHNTTFPHRPIKALTNAIRKLSLHIPFMCEMEKDLTYAEAKEEHWKANELGMFPSDILGFTAHGFALKQKDETFVEIVGEKLLELSSKSMKINTDYFRVTDDSEYDHADELLKDISRIQELAAAYIDGEFDKSGTQYYIFANATKPKKEKEIDLSEAILLGEHETKSLNGHKTHQLGEAILTDEEINNDKNCLEKVYDEPQINEEVTEDEKQFPEDLAEHEEWINEEMAKTEKKKSVKKSSNLKPSKKK